MDADVLLEEGLLCAYIFANATERAEVASIVKAKDFTDPFYRQLYQWAVKLPEPWDLTVLHHKVREMPRYSQGEFIRLAAANASPSMASIYAKQLRELTVRREIKEEAQAAISALNGKGSLPGFLKKLESIEQKASASIEQPVSKLITGRRLLEAFDSEHKRMQEDGARTEFSTPYSRVSDALGGGLMRGELSVLGGRPGDGKTTMALNLVHHYTTQGRRVLFASLEMGIYPLFSRLLAIESKLDHRSIMHGLVSPVHQEALNAARAAALEWPLTILDDTEVTYQGLEQTVREGDYDILIVDYLQLVNTESSDTMNRYERVGLVSRSLKKIARANNIPVVALAQLSRNANKPDKKPGMEDLRESGNIEQDADNIWLMHVPPDEQFKTQSKTSLIIAKNRNGPKTQMELVHFKEMAVFEDEEDAWNRSLSAPNRTPEFDEWNMD